MDDFVRRLTETWQDLSPIRKGMLTAVAIGVVVLTVVLVQWSSSTTYVTLYSGLDPTDSGRIVDQLRTRGVDYRLESGGATVRVPEGEVDELRIDFAAQGLPEGGHVGFEIFEGNSLTATDFVQRLNFQRGLQGELARTIETFPAVENARVHIVMPERSLFRDDQQPATASVVLNLRPGRALAANEVGGIAHLVAGAVEGLQKDHITILDSSGALLYDGAQAASEDGFGLTATQLQLQREYERAIESDVQAVLDRTLGPGNAVVSVRALLDFDRSETETESFAPGETGGVPRSSTSVTETYSASGDAAGAVPGAVANVPGANADIPAEPAAAADGEGAATAYERNETTTNFEVDRTVTRIVEASGEVERLSVSLLLDETVPEAQATALEASVAAAAGIDPQRGDAIVVNRLPFDRSAVEEAALAFESEASTDRILTYARMALPVVLLVLAFILLRMLLGAISRRSYYGVTMAEDEDALLPPGEGQPQIAAAAGAIRAIPGPDEIKRSELEVQVSRLAGSHPETVAEVVQSWLREE